jgi:hypothetical protein
MPTAAAREFALLSLSDARRLLRDDDSLLRQIFLNVLKQHHPKLASSIDVIYALSQAWCSSSSEEEFQALESYLMKLKPEETILVGGPAAARLPPLPPSPQRDARAAAGGPAGRRRAPRSRPRGLPKPPARGGGGARVPRAPRRGCRGRVRKLSRAPPGARRAPAARCGFLCRRAGR